MIRQNRASHHSPSGTHNVLKAQKNPNFRSPAHPQTVSYPAKIAYGVQERSGVLSKTNNGGVNLNIGLRKDGSYFYHILVGIKQQVKNASTPAQQIPFQAALGRLMNTETLKGHQVPNVGNGLPMHPFAGRNPILEYGASLWTQMNASNQKLFQGDRYKAAFEQVNTPGGVRGPETRRKVIPYDGNNLKQTNVHRPSGYDSSRTSRGRK